MLAGALTSVLFLITVWAFRSFRLHFRSVIQGWKLTSLSPVCSFGRANASAVRRHDSRPNNASCRTNSRNCVCMTFFFITRVPGRSVRLPSSEKPFRPLNAPQVLLTYIRKLRSAVSWYIKPVISLRALQLRFQRYSIELRHNYSRLILSWK
jgi:hypothetical protein